VKLSNLQSKIYINEYVNTIFSLHTIIISNLKTVKLARKQYLNEYVNGFSLHQSASIRENCAKMDAHGL